MVLSKLESRTERVKLRESTSGRLADAIVGAPYSRGTVVRSSAEDAHSPGIARGNIEPQRQACVQAGYIYETFATKETCRAAEIEAKISFGF